MKIVIDIPIDAYLMIKETTFTECEETMFLQTSEDRLKTILLFKTLDSIKNGTPYEENPQSEWIFHKDYDESCKYGCTQCGNLNNISSNFCPNCGADMRKETENEENR